MDEWAHGGLAGYSSVNGQTLNPYDLSRSPSGSSGGPAAAIAANFPVISVGNDTLEARSGARSTRSRWSA
jgi:amidase